MQDLINKSITFFSSFQSLSLLMIRLILAYGFYEPAMNKVKNFQSIIDWFRDGLHIPFPELNAYLATATEISGIILITLGLCTRFISIPMILIMIVAIKTVHLSNGFPASENGFEIPLYYMLMLFLLMTTGPGKFSLDETVFKKYFGK